MNNNDILAYAIAAMALTMITLGIVVIGFDIKRKIKVNRKKSKHGNKK